MPTIEELASQFLSDTTFNASLDLDSRRNLALELARKQIEGQSGEPVFFTASEDEQPAFNIIRAADGKPSMVMFKNAVLARAEENSNKDHLDEEGISELASSISRWPINVEHRSQQIIGAFSSGRPSKDRRAALVDGYVWADRYPQEAEGIMNGTYDLSLEAKADTAECSVCNQVFSRASDYCEHLQNRHVTGAVRKLHGIQARGGAITKRPAGTGTKFDSSQIYIVASHQEVSADAGQTSKEIDMKELEEALAKNATLQASLDQAEAALKQKDTEVAEIKASLDAQITEVKSLRIAARRARLGNLLTDEEWKERESVLASLPEEAFEFMASKIDAVRAKEPEPKKPVAPLTLPVGESVNTDRLVIG